MKLPSANLQKGSCTTFSARHPIHSNTANPLSPRVSHHLVLDSIPYEIKPHSARLQLYWAAVMNESEKSMGVEAPQPHSLRVLKVVYWAIGLVFLLSIVKTEIALQLVAGLRNIGLHILIDAVGAIPYIAVVTRAKLDFGGAADFTSLMYLLVILAHFVVGVAFLPRLRQGSTGHIFNRNDSFERLMLRRIYLFSPPLNLVGLLEVLRYTFGSAETQRKDSGVVLANDLVTHGTSKRNVLGYLCLGAFAFIVMPFYPGGFEGKMLGLVFSLYVALMIVLQVNIVFKVSLIFIAYLRRK